MLKYFLKLIKNIIKVGYVSNSLPDTGQFPKVQVEYPNKHGDAFVINPYGLYTRLPVGVQAIIFAVNGNDNNRAIIGCSRDERFKNLEEGEVLIGNVIKNTYVKFKNDGSVEIYTSGNVNINAAQTNLGSGGNQIARLGDQITVNIGGTDYYGTITSAGTNTSI
ncbi:MAG: hypothetical protein PVJ67_03740 [Candidatus Pacearchaeota archaeon]